MIKENNKLGKNIKCLRTAFGETQLELSLAIGLDSPNTISMYENGERHPKPEILHKIAAHYRITEDELLHSDFSDLHFSAPNAYDKGKMAEIALDMFPIVCSESALMDIDFKKGYDAHKRIQEAMKLENELGDVDFDTCVTSYYESYEKSKTPESLANILCWLVMMDVVINNKWMLALNEAIQNNGIKNKDILKSFYLKTFDFDNWAPSEELDLQGFEELGNIVDYLLKELRSHAEWVDLVDYYIALRFINNCVNNGLSSEMNRAIGSEMMWAFRQVENKYAKQFIQRSIKNFQA